MSAIVVENLSKRYVIGHQTQADTLRDALSGGVRAVWNRLRRQRQTLEEFYALRDVSFAVEPGEVVGIIGRNGAGKSTLLKILSRITEPTTGRIALEGRVASLLEVGTGFHPELSGRENIFLNGAILGMSRAEIRQKFDEIVAFSEVEKFLDTPVKRYSSGMYVRLAFAVAAHLEPEILIVDEVLAVGDAQFQKKCLGKMQTVAKNGGRTVLFVSHNLEAIRTICPKGLLLDQGRLVATGEIGGVLGGYAAPTAGMVATFAPSPAKPSITRVEIDPDSLARARLRVRLSFEAPKPITPVGGFILYDSDGRPLFGSNMRTHPPEQCVASASGVCTLTLEHLPLHSGTYQLSAWLGDPAQDFDQKAMAVSFLHIAPNHYGARPPLNVIGPLDLPCKWEQASA